MCTTITICRLCLNRNRRTYSISNTVLLNVWEKMTNTKFDTGDTRLFYVCYICLAHLRRSRELIQRAVKAEDLFKKYISNNASAESKKVVSLIVGKAYDIDYNYTIEKQLSVDFKPRGRGELEAVGEIKIKEEQEEITALTDDNITAREAIDTEDNENHIKEEKEFNIFNEEIVIEDGLDVEDNECNIKEEKESNTFNEDIVIQNELDVEDKEFNIKEEKEDLPESDRSRNDMVEVKTEMNDPSRNMIVRNMLHKDIRVVLERIDTGVERHNLDEIEHKPKRMKLEDTTEDVGSLGNTLAQYLPNNCNKSDIGRSSSPTYSRSDNERKIGIDIGSEKGISFQNNYFSNNELTTPIQSLPFSDDTCSYTLNSKSDTPYKQISKKGFSCQVCQRKFVRKAALTIHLRKHTGENLFVCDLCKSTFIRKDYLRDHIRHKHAKIKDFICPICQYKYATKAGLTVHLRKHTGENPFVCVTCGSAFPRKDTLNNHIRLKHIEKQDFPCHICQQSFITKAKLTIHFREHTGEKPFVCDLCDSAFPRKDYLRNHIMLQHTVKKDFTCFMCQYKCSTMNDLIEHLRSNSGEGPYLCQFCNHKFVNKCYLKSHIQSKHSTNNKFSCDICQLTFITKARLTEHLHRHTGEKPYRCDLCNSAYAIKKSLKYHQQTKHSKEKIFSCHKCQYKCTKRTYLNTHLRKHGQQLFICHYCNYKCLQRTRITYHIKSKHTKQKDYSCHICQYKTISMGHLKIHLRKHTGENLFTCDVCDSTFLYKNDLIYHIWRKHTKEKNFACHICEYKGIRRYDLTRHFRIHTGEKPYTCKFCDFKSSHANSLRGHIKYKHTKQMDISCHICEYKCMTRSKLEKHLRIHNGEKP